MENRIRQLLEMAEVESVDPTVSCFLRAAQVESVVDSSPDPPVVAHSGIVSRYISGVRVTI